ncbi:hypothetical protein BESB_001510 [Besnoitia besnoiti]|uniref:Protein kinase domain-containing protein n=1 Tax=Besnoitia besnoiti TaxID=94643 RepID=A0A2A9MIR8_BESBE|nr:hypothetical protein BESB_001510 [Besnoitia besnoiti]PFH37809.1 hypothetical protein BESB_001510 [Besnoitia besnoiti]
MVQAAMLYGVVPAFLSLALRMTYGEVLVDRTETHPPRGSVETGVPAGLHSFRALLQISAHKLPDPDAPAGDPRGARAQPSPKRSTGEGGGADPTAAEESKTPEGGEGTSSGPDSEHEAPRQEQRSRLRLSVISKRLRGLSIRRPSLPSTKKESPGAEGGPSPLSPTPSLQSRRGTAQRPLLLPQQGKEDSSARRGWLSRGSGSRSESQPSVKVEFSSPFGTKWFKGPARDTTPSPTPPSASAPPSPRTPTEPGPEPSGSQRKSGRRWGWKPEEPSDPESLSAPLTLSTESHSPAAAVTRTARALWKPPRGLLTLKHLEAREGLVSRGPSQRDRKRVVPPALAKSDFEVSPRGLKKPQPTPRERAPGPSGPTSPGPQPQRTAPRGSPAEKVGTGSGRAPSGLRSGIRKPGSSKLPLGATQQRPTAAAGDPETQGPQDKSYTKKKPSSQSPLPSAGVGKAGVGKTPAGESAGAPLRAGAATGRQPPAESGKELKKEEKGPRSLLTIGLPVKSGLPTGGLKRSLSEKTPKSPPVVAGFGSPPSPRASAEKAADVKRFGFGSHKAGYRSGDSSDYEEGKPPHLKIPQYGEPGSPVYGPSWGRGAMSGAAGPWQIKPEEFFPTEMAPTEQGSLTRGSPVARGPAAGGAAALGDAQDEGPQLQQAALIMLASPGNEEDQKGIIRTEVERWTKLRKGCNIDRGQPSPAQVAAEVLFPDGKIITTTDAEGNTVALASGGYICSGAFGVVIKVTTSRGDVFAAKLSYGKVRIPQGQSVSDIREAAKLEMIKVTIAVEEELKARRLFLKRGFSVQQFKEGFNVIVTSAILKVKNEMMVHLQRDSLLILFSSIILLQKLLGPSLKDIMQVFPPPEFQGAAARALLLAVAKLHTLGLAHGDIRASNFIFDAVGNGFLIDLASVHELHDPVAPGEKTYMPHHAPEVAAAMLSQYDYNRLVREKLDVWQTGATIFEITCDGNLPYGLIADAAFLRRRRRDLASLTRSQFSLWYCSSPVPAVAGLAYILLEPDPDKRPTISEVVSNPFFHS